MKMILVLLWGILVSSCATSPLEKKVLAQHDLIEDTIKEDKIVGKDLPNWVNQSGIENGIVYVVGKAEFDANKSPFYVEKAAIMDGEMKLLSDAPTDVRIIAQNALTGSGLDSAEFYEIQTKIKEVIGLTGMKHSQSRVTCRKVIRYGNLGAALKRACWAQVQIRANELVKAYQRTLAMKFGTYKANTFKNLMNKEIEKLEKRGNYEMANRNISNNVRNNDLRSRLPSSTSEKVKERQ